MGFHSCFRISWLITSNFPSWPFHLVQKCIGHGWLDDASISGWGFQHDLSENRTAMHFDLLSITHSRAYNFPTYVTTLYCITHKFSCNFVLPLFTICSIESTQTVLHEQISDFSMQYKEHNSACIVGIIEFIVIITTFAHAIRHHPCQYDRCMKGWSDFCLGESAKLQPHIYVM